MTYIRHVVLVSNGRYLKELPGWRNAGEWTPHLSEALTFPINYYPPEDNGGREGFGIVDLIEWDKEDELLRALRKFKKNWPPSNWPEVRLLAAPQVEGLTQPVEKWLRHG